MAQNTGEKTMLAEQAAQASPLDKMSSSGGGLRVFISYSREDAVFVDELEAGLKLIGYDVFIDRQMSGGEIWRQSLAHHIQQTDTVVFVLSPASARSEMCRWEVEEAIRLSKRILPVVCRAVADDPIPEQLRALNYVFFTDGRSFLHGLSELRDALDKNLDWIREHTRLHDLAMRWDLAAEADKPNRLLRGSDVALAKRWMANWVRPNPEPTQLHRTYIDASETAESARADSVRQELEERETMVKQRALAVTRAQRAARLSVVIIAAASILVGALGWYIFDSQTRAQARELHIKDRLVGYLERIFLGSKSAPGIRARQQVCSRAINATSRLATTSVQQEIVQASREFWELYFGEMNLLEQEQGMIRVVVELKKGDDLSAILNERYASKIEGAMVRFGHSLKGLEQSPLPHTSLMPLAQAVKLECSAYLDALSSSG